MLVKGKAFLATISSPAYFFKQLLINNSGETVGTRLYTPQTTTKKQSNSKFLPSYVYKCHLPLQL